MLSAGAWTGLLAMGEAPRSALCSGGGAHPLHACLQRVYSVFTACLQRVYSMFTACLQHVYSARLQHFHTVKESCSRVCIP